MITDIKSDTACKRVNEIGVGEIMSVVSSLVLAILAIPVVGAAFLNVIKSMIGYLIPMDKIKAKIGYKKGTMRFANDKRDHLSVQRHPEELPIDNVFTNYIFPAVELIVEFADQIAIRYINGIMMILKKVPKLKNKSDSDLKHISLTIYYTLTVGLIMKLVKLLMLKKGMVGDTAAYKSIRDIITNGLKFGSYDLDFDDMERESDIMFSNKSLAPIVKELIDRVGSMLHIFEDQRVSYRDFYVNLMEAFGDDQKKKWLANNPTLTSDQIDIYIKWFDELRKSKPAAAKTINIDGIPKGDDRFDISKYSDWHSFESFVDAVRAQTQLKGEKLSDNLEVIDGKPLFQKNGLEVYYADTPRACIKYKGSVPYSWCVSRTDSSNMFYSYRLRGDNPAFYFVKDVKATQKELSSGETFSGTFSNKWHFFVIQVLKTANIKDLTKKSYVVTSANNDNDIFMSWNDIVNIQPKLHGLQSKFIPKPLSDEEISIINKYRNGLTFNEFIRLSYNEKERFLDVYPTLGKPITNEIFNALPYELKNKYIGMSIGLSDEQYRSIQSDKNLLNRYVQIVKKKLEVWLKKFTLYHFDFHFVDSERHVLLKYGILENHVNQLTYAHVESLLNTHIQSSFPLTSSSDKQITRQIIDVLLNKNIELTDSNLDVMLYHGADEQKIVDKLLNSNIALTDIAMEILFKYRDKQNLVDTMLNKNLPLTDKNVWSLLYHATDKQKTIDVLLNKNVPLTDKNVTNLLKYSPDKQKTIDTLLNKNIPLTENNVKSLLRFSPNIQTTIDTLFDKNVELTDDVVNNLIYYSPDKQKTIDILLNKNLPLTDRNVWSLLYHATDKQKTIDTLLNKNIPLTDRNVKSLVDYLPTKLAQRELKRKIDALKLKQQLSETKFRYRDFFKDLLLELEFKVVPYSEHPHGFIYSSVYGEGGNIYENV